MSLSKSIFLKSFQTRNVSDHSAIICFCLINNSFVFRKGFLWWCGIFQSMDCFTFFINSKIKHVLKLIIHKSIKMLSGSSKKWHANPQKYVLVAPMRSLKRGPPIRFVVSQALDKLLLWISFLWMSTKTIVLRNLFI